MLGGYKGLVLRVDLARRDQSFQKLSEENAREYLGGSGLATRILIDELRPEADPLGPENKLIFMTGPLTGTNAPCCGRYAVVSKSPLTGIYAESGSAGYWGPELKFAGFDGIVIEGRASKPLYLWIRDGQVETKNAEYLWGKTTDETEEGIKRDLGDQRIKVASIGPAGERLAKIACIVNDGGRAAGRCGLGAVMGSKNLKAIAVSGTSEVVVYDEIKFSSATTEVMKRIKASPNTEFSRKYGTAGYVEACEAIGDLPTRNWTEDSWKMAERISGQHVAETILKRPYTCYLCPIACGKIVTIERTPHSKSEAHGPEYETCASMGSMLLNEDLEAIARSNDICNRYGIDTISCGSAIAFAMECYAEHILTKGETDGLDLTWGNSNQILELVRKIGEREGIGYVLGEGVRLASRKFGLESERFALHVKGLELPMHDPRAYESLALGYATSNRGACHLAAASHWVEGGTLFPEIGIKERPDRFSTEGKARIVAEMQDIMGVADSLVVCKFALSRGFSLTYLAEVLTAATGFNMTIKDLLRIGERIFNLKRMFNNSLGISKKDDALPKRVLLTKIGSNKWHAPNLGHTLFEYYKLRGWNVNGRPAKRKLQELNLTHIINRREPSIDQN